MPEELEARLQQLVEGQLKEAYRWEGSGTCIEVVHEHLSGDMLLSRCPCVQRGGGALFPACLSFAAHRTFGLIARGALAANRGTVLHGAVPYGASRRKTVSKEVRGAAVGEAQAAATAALEAAAAAGGPSYTPLQISMALKVP